MGGLTTNGKQTPPKRKRKGDDKTLAQLFEVNVKYLLSHHLDRL